MEKELKVLEVLNKNKNISQRDIAKLTDISLGKINYILKDLILEGYIKSEKDNRRFNYCITNLGIELLEKKFKSIDERRISLQGDVPKVNYAVILAAGERSEFDKPVGLLKINEETILDRTIALLRKNGIENIVVVSGYKNDDMKEYCHRNGVEIIYNPKYKWTGTMASLALAKDYLKGDFILVESDLVYEESAIKNILEHKRRDCILITNESGSGDEAFVEIRNGYIYKLGKDIHMFNKIHGEMIGILKISKDVFDKMLVDFDSNVNPYLNYEYALLDVARTYDIAYEKIDDLVWGEVDNLEHYEYITNYLLAKLKKREDEIFVSKLKSYLVDALKVKEDDITEIEHAGGMTNKNFRVDIKEKKYILRVPGTGTEEMISRKDEKVNSEVGCALGIDAHVLYFDENNGIKIAEFIENAETLTGTSAKKEENMKLTTDILRKLHTSGEKLSNRFDIWGKIELYEELLGKANGENFKDYDGVKSKVLKLKERLKELGVEEMASHNDTVPENFIKSGDNKIYLIDWEYSGMNDPMWDLAAHSIECNFSKSDEELFLNLYFDGEYGDDIKERILIHKICQDFLWSVWTKIKEAKGDDFGTYGMDRYERCKKNLKLLSSYKAH